MPLTKIAQMVLLYQKGASPELLDKKCRQTSPEPMVQIHNNFTEMFLMIPSTKIAQRVGLHQTKVQPEY